MVAITQLVSLALLALLSHTSRANGAVKAAEDDPNVRRIPLRAHSLQAPYLDTDMQSRFFDFGDDTLIRADQYIRLTADRGGQSGWLFGKVPMSATNWQIEIEFRIHGQGHLHGDGMAIWLTEQRAQPGKVFGNTDQFDGLGIFIDTYKNSRVGTVFPYVMAMIGNSTNRYNKDSDGKEQELAGCSARQLRSDHDDAPNRRMRITYYQDSFLRVELSYNDNEPEEWTECFETPPIKLPQTAYLGFSAETGEVSDAHDILSVTAHNLHVRTDQSKGSGAQQGSTQRVQGHPYNPGGDKAPGSWRWFFLKIILFGLFVVVSYVGFTVYRANKRGRF